MEEEFKAGHLHYSPHCDDTKVGENLQFPSKSQWVHGILTHSHVVEGGCCPETALCSPGQSVPRILGQVTISCMSVLLLILLVFQSVEAHEG